MTLRPLTRAYVVGEALDDIFRMAEAAGPYETGGLVLGPRSSESVWIARAIEIRPELPSTTRYAIPAGVTHSSVDAIRACDVRIGYIGDWHTHPADAGPSLTDVSSLRANARRSGGAQRLVALVRRGAAGWHLALWGIHPQSRDPVEIPFEVTGPLPPA